MNCHSEEPRGSPQPSSPDLASTGAQNEGPGTPGVPRTALCCSVKAPHNPQQAASTWKTLARRTPEPVGSAGTWEGSAPGRCESERLSAQRTRMTRCLSSLVRGLLRVSPLQVDADSLRDYKWEEGQAVAFLAALPRRSCSHSPLEGAGPLSPLRAWGGGRFGLRKLPLPVSKNKDQKHFPP